MNDPGPCPTRGAPRVDDAPDAGAAAPTPRSTARWALLAGRRGRGRIGQLEAAIAGLRGRGIRVGGVVQRALDDDRGEHTGYVAVELAGGREVVLARPSTSRDAIAPAGVELICSYTFDSAAFDAARAWVERDAGTCDVVVIDEVSKLEVGRGGHHAAVEIALAGRALTLLSVRSEQLFAVMDRYGLDEPVASLEAGDPGEVFRLVDAISAATAARR